MILLQHIIDFLFPKYCIICGNSGSSLCTACISRLHKPDSSLFDDIDSAFHYKDKPAKKILHSFKFKNNHSLAAVLARVLHDRMLDTLSERLILDNFTDPLLIPIPITKKKRRERGFNQTELLCKELLKINSGDGIKYNAKILIKTKETKPQSLIKNRQLRMKNILGCFEVADPELIKNRNIILIDDIVTTGATLREAKRVLKKAGARRVIAFAIAH